MRGGLGGGYRVLTTWGWVGGRPVARRALVWLVDDWGLGYSWVG